MVRGQPCLRSNVMCSSAPTSVERFFSTSSSHDACIFRTCQSIHRRWSALLDLGDYTRGAACRSHHVRKRVKRTRTFCIWRWCFLVFCTPRRLPFGVCWKRSLSFSLCNGCSASDSGTFRWSWAKSWRGITIRLGDGCSEPVW